MSPPSETPEPDAPAHESPLNKGVLYRTLAQLWFFPSFGAGIIVAMKLTPWPDTATLLHRLGTEMELMIAAGLWLAHAFFLIQARRFHHLNPRPSQARVTP